MPKVKKNKEETKEFKCSQCGKVNKFLFSAISVKLSVDLGARDCRAILSLYFFIIN